MTAWIPEDEFYRLPPTLQEKLRVYSKALVEVRRGGVLVFTIADERYEEIVEEMAVHAGD